MRATTRHTLTALLIGSILATFGCTDSIDVGDSLATVSNVRVLAADVPPTLVKVAYILSDVEGDDQDLAVLVCAASGDEISQCGFPFEGPGSDGVTFVPTAPAGTNQPHQFVWDVGCGRVLEGAQNPMEAVVRSDLDQSYVMLVGIEDAPNSRTSSKAFTLADLGFEDLPPCTDENAPSMETSGE